MFRRGQSSLTSFARASMAITGLVELVVAGLAVAVLWVTDSWDGASMRRIGVWLVVLGILGVVMWARARRHLARTARNP